MKKMLLGIFALLLAVATVFATTVERKRSVENATVYHWFDGQIFVGEGTVDDMRPLCNQLDNIECLAGYNPNVGETRPITQPQEVLTKD